MEGRKDVLDVWVGESESAKYWATVLNSLKNRGVKDIFIVCTDNLTGFSAAIEAVFPKTEIRRLIYTTNTIEGFNRQLRKVVKAKSVFPTDDSLLKILYLVMKDITKKWTGRRQDWFPSLHLKTSLFHQFLRLCRLHKI